eukprot:CAMPEP_0183702842 /NCGR_PEP_ID=MMETSP0737-20130205/811_1 /TAXON_ID=385413 /ORGANISM="Thalassiosira miniscula, Strain CCMP1093" /LENGTH=925 /DNA_ID=CAMNT_0025929519 /DNA_START=277 /DNA_END=3054 /DNA_ORIENTATION=-
MPTDKKKSSPGKGSEKNAAAAPKLHASAKEFVPSAATLKATATAWKPTGASSPAANGAKDNGKAPAAAATSAADAVKQAPKAKAAPAASAWGSKPSDAIKKAAPIRQQQKPATQKQQQQQGRGGGQGGKRGDRSGGRNDQRGGGGNSSGSWGRNTGKPGHGNKDGSGGNRRQSQNRGGNGSSGDQGDRGGDNSNWSRGKAVPVELMEPGEGKTDAEKAVKRINVDDLLDMRLNCLAAPSSWEGEDATKPPPACLWDSPTRVSEIEEKAKVGRIGGDVSRNDKKKKKPNPNDTAPALEDCKPLEVNDETRWKPKVMDGKDAAKPVESKEEVLRQATLILNKLSLTKFDKLSDEFINCGIGRDVECLTGAVGLIVNYAQEQQHFSSMYAGLCLKLSNTPMEGIDEGSKKGKKFKKILLTRCQHEFETDTATKIKEATKGITNEEEIEYHANLIKKHYLGHMRFIGELYKGDLISIKIMLFCLPALLKGENEDSSNEVDEEKVECFSKLMTVIGSSLEQQSEAMKSIGKADAAESLAECWKIVEIMAGKRKEEGPQVSNRIKFMLQDLLEMKAKGWVTRRKEETAKTIAQIHKEVAKEERAARRSNSSASLRGMSKSSIRRGASSGDVRVLDNKQSKPQVDEDGFVSVASSKGFNRSSSMTAMHRSQSEGFQKYNTRGSTVLKADGGSGRRPSQSKFAVLNENNSRRSSKKGSSNKLDEKAAASPEKEKKPVEEKPKVNYPTPDECGEKAKNALKEYFVGGDTDDAVLSIHELVGTGDEGSVERGTKVVESAVLLVLEMKAEDVDKFLSVYLRCAKEKKIEGEAFIQGLNDPLEFLSDIAIDAPLAIPHLASIVAELVKADIIPFSFLLNSPDYFRTDQNAADFGAKVMKKIGGDVVTSEDYIEVIEKLMTDEDKAKHSSAGDLIAEA